MKISLDAALGAEMRAELEAQGRTVTDLADKIGVTVADAQDLLDARRSALVGEYGEVSRWLGLDLPELVKRSGRNAGQYSVVATAIATARNFMGLTVEQFAGKVGTSPECVRRVEAGEFVPAPRLVENWMSRLVA